ncbi:MULTISPECIES: hypothetical protein [Proteus]|uniref:Uncharacterized protein n=4 Tax=Proteus mirabilis TaxID=584 RepID=A0A379FHG9_PROMI|nr:MULTISPECIES: hypothetical protein [Proteus]MBA7797630.1 hypothetical protein [Citrobacter sp. RHBSTW-01065]MDD8915340.1 hypothetical protein [Escherichia coli]SSL80028.1 Uncharacterised protein [Klebsiella pneumoniae]ATC73123.1 hypothetical protein BG257_00155 [Proteus mirabilis]ATC78184.1 hypothetical protein BG029_06955 [Proteus mirabilis]
MLTNTYGLRNDWYERQMEREAFVNSQEDKISVDEVMDSLPEELLCMDLARKLNPVFEISPQALDAVLAGIRTAIQIGIDKEVLG